MTKHFLLRHILCCLFCIITCVGCSSSTSSDEPPKPATKPETDNNFEQSSFDYHWPWSGQSSLISTLKEQNIQFTKYGDTITLTIPSDQYFNFNSTEINDSDFGGLNNTVKLLNFYPKNIKYVTAFTDKSGTSQEQLDLTQGRAERIVTFLWANGIPAQALNAQGYGDQFSLGSNKSSHSRSYNRRVEIQWTATKGCCPPNQISQSVPLPTKGKKGLISAALKGSPQS
ncbi:MAG: OmpA family protein [Gammaproteobacteria bacterium]